MNDADTIPLSRAAYVAVGAMDTFSGPEVDACLAAVTPLAFWRNHRGLPQETLAAQIGIAQSSLAQAETGRRGLKATTYARLAKALGTRMEDLLGEA